MAGSVFSNTPASPLYLITAGLPRLGVRQWKKVIGTDGSNSREMEYYSRVAVEVGLGPACGHKVVLR